MIETETRCGGCKVLCNDMDTLKIHERFCRKNTQKLNRSGDTGTPIPPEPIKTCIETPAAQCTVCRKRSIRRHRCLMGYWK